MTLTRNVKYSYTEFKEFPEHGEAIPVMDRAGELVTWLHAEMTPLHHKGLMMARAWPASP